VEVHERKTPGSQDIMYRYALAEITKDDAIGRSFRLLKPLEARQKRDDGPYYVHLSFTDPKYDRCVCTGFDAHGHCKHVDALRALHTEGKFS
jgi:hypothetical protein